jgi:stearoyl-CoA desaturase (delta-9 desaturase)
MNLFYGLLNLSWWGYVIYALLLTHITIISVTIYLHRYSAHRALSLHPAVEHFFRFWLWMTTGMKTKEWVAVHRKHHAKCETPEDPHSPVYAGIETVLWQGAELYRKAKKDPATIATYGKGTPNDWLERHVYSSQFLHGKQGVLLMLIINLILLGVPGTIVWAIQMMWVPFWAAGVVNGLGHYFGYRNFEAKDASTNIFPIGILIGGEELHNNHHAYGNSAKLSMKWWEFDIGWMYIKLLCTMNLAEVKRLPPQVVLAIDQKEASFATAKAVIANRLGLLAAYHKQVIQPAIAKEHHKLNSKYHLAKLLTRNPELLNPAEKTQLTQLLNSSKALHAVHSFRNHLQSIWETPAANDSSLVSAINQWCQQAELTGIGPLVDFAGFVRSYRIITRD